MSKLPSLLFITLVLLTLTSCDKDPSTFSNYDQIIQTSIEGNYKLDFDTSTITGKVKIYFKAQMDGEVIILDTSGLTIQSVIDSDTGDELEWVLDTKHALDSLGTPLKIYKEYFTNETIPILISYQTSPSGAAIQWLKPEMTSGKIYPYMFTQCESILCRTLLPCQDTPSAKITVSTSITVPKPLMALNSGIYQSKIENTNTTTYFYYQKIPIPSYLIAIAAGALEGRKISERTTVYAEAEDVDAAALEFADTDKFIQIAESYTFAYEWGEYNILVLPPSFPYGGMENPCLTFATPSLIAGDKSLANVIAHEISHSWSGNLVTMSSWSDFWLNEGFTMFLQRKIDEEMFNIDVAKVSAQIGYFTLQEKIATFGASHDFTSLHPYLVGVNPDDAFSTIPYEKGYNFLYFLEQIINKQAGEDLFKLILRRYFTKFKYQSIAYMDFKTFLEEQLYNEFGFEGALNITQQINWQNWIFEPGLPTTVNDFTSTLSDDCDKYLTKMMNGGDMSNFNTVFTEWHEYQREYFLKLVIFEPKASELTDKQYAVLNNTLNLGEGWNSEISYMFFTIMLLNKKTDDASLAMLEKFLAKYGRMKFIRPLYVELAKINKTKAVEMFNKYKSIYHPIAVRLIELDFSQII